MMDQHRVSDDCSNLSVAQSQPSNAPDENNSAQTDRLLSLQWNINGLQSNADDLLVLVYQNPPIAIALQETRNKDHSFMGRFLKERYTWFNRVDPVNSASRGVSLAVRTEYAPEQVNLDPSIPAVAATIRSPCLATLVSLYLPPDTTIEELTNTLYTIFHTSAYPVILMGDLNAHHTAWGCHKSDYKGKAVLSFAVENDLVVLNSGEGTRLDLATGSMSAIDLTIVPMELAYKLKWTVNEDCRCSDHFPIEISLVGEGVSYQSKRRQWIFNLADWGSFEDSVNQRTDQISDMDKFTEVVRSSAIKFIPRTSARVGRKSVSWWNPEVEKAVKFRRKMLRKMKKLPDDHPGKVGALKAFQLARNASRKTIREAKRSSWDEFVQSFNPNTPINLIWRNVRMLSGKSSGSTPTLLVDGVVLEDPKEVADIIAGHLQQVYQPSDLDESSFSGEPVGVENQYNCEITMDELLWAIDQGNGNSVGPDLLGYPMMKHLPFRTKTVFLELINRIWETGNIPKEWKEGTVIPLPKPGKDPKVVGNQRPITLLSCAGKTMERIINRRLIETIEAQRLLDPRQYAFRRGRGLDLYLADLEGSIDDAWSKWKHSELVALDISKAYDRISNKAIIRQLESWGLSGRMLNYVRSYLKERHFRVAVGGALSDRMEQTNGVPQGSILAVTLFAIGMNSLFNRIPKGVKIFVYADDILLLVSGLNAKAVRRVLQKAVKCVSVWAAEVGFSIASEKSNHMHICRRRKHQKLRKIRLDGKSIPEVKSMTVLGVTLTSSFRFEQHVKVVKKRCKTRIQLLRTLGQRIPGGTRKTLMYIAKATILPVIFHGWGIVSRGGKNVRKLLEPVYNDILRITSGAFRTSPVLALCAESGELPFELLACHKLVAKSSKLEEKKALSNFDGEWPITRRAKDSFMDLADMDLPPVESFPVPTRRSWNSAMPKADWSIKSQFKVGEAPTKARTLFMALEREKYKDFTHVFTDGSRDEDGRVGLAIVDGNNNRCERIPDGCSIFSAESKAIVLALKSIVSGDRTVVFTDSASCVAAIQGDITNHPWIRAAQIEMERTGAVLCWIPGHTDIPGNSVADAMANEGREKEIADRKIPAVDRIQWCKKVLERVWEAEWYQARDVKLRRIKPSTAAWKDRKDRKEQRILTRLRIGHTRMTHDWLMQKRDQNACQHCGTQLSVEHVLTECQEYETVRRNLDLEFNICEILCFDKDREEKVLKFVKLAGIEDKI